jgi:DNA polymerase-3 subunit alpha
MYNTVKIAEMIDCQIPIGECYHCQILRFQKVTTKDSFYLTELVNTGATKKVWGDCSDHVKQPYEYELSVIQRMQFSGYFLVVWDLYQFAKKHGIPVGPGRVLPRFNGVILSGDYRA